MIYLFVYGTLRKACDQGKHALIAYCGEYVCDARMHGRLYEIAGYPGAVESGRPDEQVYGELYRIREMEPLFVVLDDYEECSASYPAPHEYVRKQLTVTLADETTETAWVYLYNRNPSRLTQIPTGDYVNYLNGSSYHSTIN